VPPINTVPGLENEPVADAETVLIIFPNFDFFANTSILLLEPVRNNAVK